MLNDAIWRAIKRAQVPAHKEPVGLFTQGGKRPDGATLIPWAKGKPLAWDVTVLDTFCRLTHQQHLNGSRFSGQASGDVQGFQVR